MRVVRGTIVVGLLVVLMGAVAGAGERTKPSIHFFANGESESHWTPEDSADDDKNGMSIEMQIGPLVGTDYAGWEFNHEEGSLPPETEPSYMHKEDRAGPSGGSPRLVIEFPTGVMYLRPDEWTTTWQQVGGGSDDGNWDVSSDACPFLYDAEYEEALACFGATEPISNVFMVTDSNWLYAGGYTNWVDVIVWDSYTYSHASDNNNSQGPPVSLQ